MTSRGFGVLIGVLVAGPISGAHLNPAVRSPVILNIIIKAMIVLIIRIILTIIIILLFLFIILDFLIQFSTALAAVGKFDWRKVATNIFIWVDKYSSLSGQIFLFEWTNILHEWKNILFELTNISIWVEEDGNKCIFLSCQLALNLLYFII